MSTIQDTDTRIKITEWVNKYTDDLFKYAYSRLTSREAAEDIVQNVFVAACENCEKFMNQSSPKTWLFGILKNKIADFHRKNYSEKEIVSDLAGGPDSAIDKYFNDEGEWLKEHIPGEWQSEEDTLLENPEFNIVLKQCLDALPGKWNSAIHLKYLDETGADRICETLGISQQNYWQVIRRAKLKLRECLTDSWFENR